jgi:hypothetical protein
VLTGDLLQRLAPFIISALLTKFFRFFIILEGQRSAVPALASLAWIPNTAGRKPVL